MRTGTALCVLACLLTLASVGQSQMVPAAGWEQLWGGIVKSQESDQAPATGEVLRTRGQRVLILMSGSVIKGQLLQVRRTTAVGTTGAMFPDPVAQVLVTASYPPLVLGFIPRLLMQRPVKVGDSVLAIPPPEEEGAVETNTQKPSAVQEAAGASAMVVLVNGMDVYLDATELVVGAEMILTATDGTTVKATVAEVTANMSRLSLSEPAALHRGDEVQVSVDGQ